MFFGKFLRWSNYDWEKLQKEKKDCISFLVSVLECYHISSSSRQIWAASKTIRQKLMWEIWRELALHYFPADCFGIDFLWDTYLLTHNKKQKMKVMGKVARLILVVVVSVCVVCCVLCCFQNNPVFLSVTIFHILKNENYELCFLANFFVDQITTGIFGIIFILSVQFSSQFFCCCFPHIWAASKTTRQKIMF